MKEAIEIERRRERAKKLKVGDEVFVMLDDRKVVDSGIITGMQPVCCAAIAEAGCDLEYFVEWKINSPHTFRVDDSGQGWARGVYFINEVFALENEDDAMAEKHGEIADEICTHLEFMRSLKAQHQEEIRRIDNELLKIENSVKAGRWYELEGVIMDESIEVLSECEPIPTSELLDRGAWL